MHVIIYRNRNLKSALVPTKIASQMKDSVTREKRFALQQRNRSTSKRVDDNTRNAQQMSSYSPEKRTLCNYQRTMTL